MQTSGLLAAQGRSAVFCPHLLPGVALIPTAPNATCLLIAPRPGLFSLAGSMSSVSPLHRHHLSPFLPKQLQTKLSPVQVPAPQDRKPRVLPPRVLFLSHPDPTQHESPRLIPASSLHRPDPGSGSAQPPPPCALRFTLHTGAKVRWGPPAPPGLRGLQQGPALPAPSGAQLTLHRHPRSLARVSLSL